MVLSFGTQFHKQNIMFIKPSWIVIYFRESLFHASKRTGLQNSISTTCRPTKLFCWAWCTGNETGCTASNAKSLEPDERILNSMNCKHFEWETRKLNHEQSVEESGIEGSIRILWAKRQRKTFANTRHRCSSLNTYTNHTTIFAIFDFELWSQDVHQL